MAITVCLQYDDVEHATGWLHRVFGATQLGWHETDGRVSETELELDGTPLLLRRTSAGDAVAPPVQVPLLVTVEALDPAYRRVLAEGSAVTGAPETDRDGRRAFTTTDPQGYRWTVTEAVVTDVDADRQLGALTDLCTPYAVRVLATLRVPDHLDAGLTALEPLASACGADPDALGRLLRYLAHRGVVSEPEPDVFTLTDVGRLLCDRGAAGQRDWLDLDGLGARMDLAYRGLLHSVRTGTAGYEQVHGRTFWADLDAEPALRAYFDALMMSQQHVTAPQVAELYDWSGAAHVVDVGGGSGALLAELLHRHPHLRGTFVDRPIAAEAAARRLAAEGLADRVTIVAGDFFSPLPGGADVYVVSRALTDWNDRDASTILRRCADAAGDDGRVLVVEVLPTEPYVPYRSPFDLQMLAVVGGRERGLPDFRDIASAVDLDLTTVLHGRAGLTLMEYVAARSTEPATVGDGTRVS
ncbi:methyltransferase [Micromonospora sp. NPDC004704]